MAGCSRTCNQIDSDPRHQHKSHLRCCPRSRVYRSVWSSSSTKNQISCCYRELEMHVVLKIPSGTLDSGPSRNIIQFPQGEVNQVKNQITYLYNTFDCKRLPQIYIYSAQWETIATSRSQRRISAPWSDYQVPPKLDHIETKFVTGPDVDDITKTSTVCMVVLPYISGLKICKTK